MLKNILVRSLSGAVYVALIVTAVLLLENSPTVFLVVFSLFAAWGIKEIYGMVRIQGQESWLLMGLDMLGGVGLFLAMFIAMRPDGFRSGLWLLPPCVYVVMRLVAQLYRPEQDAVKSLSRSMLGMCYVAFPLSMLNAIVGMSSPRTLLAVFVFIWINDTGAFLTGVTLGRHRLWERISPKKSWEGFFGGVVFCVLAALAFDRWLNEFFQVPQLGVWVGLSVLVAVVATLGDLVESLLKRTVGVKDSSHLIPGHGGLLDRIDSLLLVAPAVMVFLYLVINN